MVCVRSRASRINTKKDPVQWQWLLELHVRVLANVTTYVLRFMDQRILRCELFCEHLCFCLWLEYLCSRLGFQCWYIRSLGLGVEQLLCFSPPRFAGRKQIAELLCALAAIFLNACENASATCLGGYTFVGRTFRIDFLFDQRLDRAV